MLDRYKRSGAWSDYEREFLNLLAARRIEVTLSRSLLDGSCLLCSEDRPEDCHRRLVAEYLAASWHDVAIRHL
jgi:hypothetical protein